MITCKDVISFLNSNYPYTATFSELSNNRDNIKSNQVVYNYDKIKTAIFKDNCRSADALLIKRNINLIEFKTGFSSLDENLSDQIKKENMICSIRLKACESLQLLKRAILEEIDSNDKLDPKIKITFCAVIDSGDPAVADDAYVDVVSGEGKKHNTSSIKSKASNIDNILKSYRMEMKTPVKAKKLFYDNTFVLYDFEFDSQINRFK